MILGAGRLSDVLVTHTPIHSDHEAKQWWLQEKRVIDSRSLEELNVVMLKDTDTSNVPVRWQRWDRETNAWSVREWERQLERWRCLFPQRGNTVWPKKVGLTVARGKGHWQENWFMAWSRLPDLCSRTGGIHLRTAAEKMIPVRIDRTHIILY